MRGAISGVVGDIETKALYGLANLSDEEIAKHISPPGKLQLPVELLPPLLERRRVEYYCPDQAFDIMPAVDTVHVWQIGQQRATFSKGGRIVMSEQGRDQSRFESPRGIIVTAGLLALDQLRSHGMDLGHVVYLLRMSPYRLPMDLIGHRDVGGLLVLHAGDIKGSEDTMAMLRSGELRVKRIKERAPGGEKTVEVMPDGTTAERHAEIERHVYVRTDGTHLTPSIPWQPEET